jgi:hypothetical protein
MPSDEARRLLKLFGVAVTEFEDAVLRAAPAEEIKQADAEMRARSEEIEGWIDRLRRRAADTKP